MIGCEIATGNGRIVSVCIIEDDCNWYDIAIIVGEMKCRNVEHDFVGLKSHLQAIMCRMVDLSDKRCPD